VKHKTSALAFFFAVVAGITFALSGWPQPALAGPGHDHGEEAPITAGTASPRFAAHSDLFEIVGIAKNQAITLYVDRYTTNEPVTNAKVEYELNGSKGIAAGAADGTYVVPLNGVKAPAELALSFTITSGVDMDLLASNLSLPDPHADHDHSASNPRAWMLYSGIAAAVILAIAAALLLRRRRIGAA
jgi:hypothetical protein